MGEHARAIVRKAGIAAFWLLVWEAASLAVGSRLLLASPLDTLLRLVSLVPTASFWKAVGFSLARVAAGFCVAFAAALVLGFASRRWRVAGELLGPAVSFLKSVPIVCIIVLLLMWVGSRQVSGIAVFLAVFPAVYFSVREGLAAADPRLGECLALMGVAPGRRFLASTWQQLLPYLVGTCKNACGMAWKAGVAAELIGSPRGSMGEAIYQSKLLLETADLFAWTIAVVALSWLCEKAFLWLLGRTGTWALRAAVPRKAADSPLVSPVAVGFEGVTTGYGGAVVSRGVNLRLAPGTRMVLSSESGSGKTTLLLTAEGLLPPLAGRVSAPRHMAVVFQEPRLVEGMTAEQNVLLVVGRWLDEDAVRGLLLEVLPPDALGRPVRELSGGQRRRVELVRALAYPAGVVVLDEPFASLDEDAHRTSAAFVLRHLAGRTLLVASHAPGDATLLAAREVRPLG